MLRLEHTRQSHRARRSGSGVSARNSSNTGNSADWIAARGQPRPRLTRPLRDEGEHHPLDRVAVQATVGGDPADRRADTEAFPHPVQRPGRAQAPRVQHLDPTGPGRRGHGLFRAQEPRDQRHQPGQRRPVDLVGPPETVDHLRDRVTADRVALVVRQLQIAHHRAVPVGPPGLPREHAYNSTSSPQLMSSDTPKIVCLQEFKLWNTPHRPDQAEHSRPGTHVPVIFGSPVWLLCWDTTIDSQDIGGLPDQHAVGGCTQLHSSAGVIAGCNGLTCARGADASRAVVADRIHLKITALARAA
ncbi:MAG TPA: hypothetical protein VFW64_02390 [Pseudonocardiaceae bacterium]|nr:hypothetical protein [Pseudonocardiaceae bacterium]